jgi:hypothetical protein
MNRRTNNFQAIRSEGGLLSPDLFRQVLDPKEKLDGTRPEDYSLPQGERLNEVITQSWNRLRKHWTEFRSVAMSFTKGEPATGLTNDKWNLPLLRELGFGLLPSIAGPGINGRTYAINRFFGLVPIHLVGCGLNLDHRSAGVRGAATNPHGLVQEFLNRSDEHLWAIVSNGLHFRILRDNQTLSRQSFIEFDLEAMFDGEIYSDFVLFWLVAHASRFAPREAGRPETCWLEQWTKLADEQGIRALGDLRGAVEKALQTLGEGFTSHSKNAALRDALRTGQVKPADFHGQLLRIIYRLIFLFVAEDRTLDGQSLLHPLDDSEAARIARERFATHYSTARLRELSSKIKGSRHGDLWRQFQLLVGALSGDSAFAAAREHLALPVLGSFLWNPTSTAVLNNAELTNHDFLECLRHLAFARQGKILRPVNYKNLGAEELGGVYESLLALTPQISADGARFTFAEFAGNERKYSGSYYTPDSLVQCLLDSALDPLVEEAIKGKAGADAEKAILALRVCDPAVGSGHFLVGAAHRLARYLARVRALAQGESEPSPVHYQHALRDVIGRCLYGVDENPMAAELCRVSLWLESIEPGKPLSFLDHHIRVGNSLLGATPELIAAGLPDEAFTAIEGDDKKACAALKKRNRAERRGLGPLFADQEADIQVYLQQGAAAMEELPDDRLEDVLAKEQAFHRQEKSNEYRHKKLLADTWCAAFVVRKYFREPGRENSSSGITQGHINDVAEGQALPTELETEIEQLSRQYRFFHWHLAFPEVFARGGFDLILGNPPWEHVELKEIEWFTTQSPDIANAPTAAERKRMIKALAQEDPALHSAFLSDLRKADGERHIARDSGLYPMCGVGRINTYAIFSELNRRLMNPQGRAGFIVPSGIASDDTTKFFFRDLVECGSLASLYDFENRQAIFPDVHRSYKFCLLTLTGREITTKTARFVFFALRVEDLHDEYRQFTLTADDLALLNPNTRTCPIFRSQRDAELTKAIYRRVPILWQEEPEQNPWYLQFKQGLFNMASDSHQFRTANQLEAEGYKLEGNIFCSPFDRYLPLYEAKMLHQFDHRWCTYHSTEETHDLSPKERANPAFAVQSRYWVREEIVESIVPHYPESLHLALTLAEASSVHRLLHLWAAGDALNRGDATEAREFFDRAPAFDEESRVAVLFAGIDIENWFINLSRRFPLTVEDRTRLSQLTDDWTNLARELVTRFSPKWLMGWRDICRSTDERTLIAAALPRVAVGHVFSLLFPQMGDHSSFPLLLANCNSFALDYVARQKVGGVHITFSLLKQFPVFPPDFYYERRSWQPLGENFGEWVRKRVIELTYTSHDLRAFAEDCGWKGQPFLWDESRRATIRAELDAAYLHAYGLNRDETTYVLSAANFPIVAAKRPDIFPNIIAIYDAMSEAIQSGIPFRSLLTPPPGGYSAK